MSCDAAEADDGPCGGMLPPYHVRHERFASVSVAPPQPFLLIHAYADDGEFIWLWQPDDPQLPRVPLFKYVFTIIVQVGAAGGGGGLPASLPPPLLGLPASSPPVFGLPASSPPALGLPASGPV